MMLWVAFRICKQGQGHAECIIKQFSNFTHNIHIPRRQKMMPCLCLRVAVLRPQTVILAQDIPCCFPAKRPQLQTPLQCVSRGQDGPAWSCFSTQVDASCSATEPQGRTREAAPDDTPTGHASRFTPSRSHDWLFCVCCWGGGCWE